MRCSNFVGKAKRKLWRFWGARLLKFVSIRDAIYSGDIATQEVSDFPIRVAVPASRVDLHQGRGKGASANLSPVFTGNGHGRDPPK